jgi:hypothetical protein
MNSLAINDTTEVVAPSFFWGDDEVTFPQLQAQCDDVITDLYKTGDEAKVKSAVLNLATLSAHVGKGQAILLAGWAKWYKEKHPDGNFFDYYSDITAADRQEVRKAVLVGQLLESSEISDGVKVHPAKSLVHIARALEGGYEIDEETWDELEKAGNEREVSHIIQEKVKKRPERKGTLTIKVYPDGTIRSFRDDVTVLAGDLNYADLEPDSNLSEDERKLLRETISRIETNSGMRK